VIKRARRIVRRKRTLYVTLNIDPRRLMTAKANPKIKYLDLTREVNRIIDRHGIKEGILNVQIKHTTAALSWLMVQENEMGLIEYDIPRFLGQLIPKGQPFMHDREERMLALGENEPRNAVSHLFASVFPASVTLNVHNYKLDCGTYQSLILFDFDSEHHPGRQVSVVIERRM